jgi:ubiquinone/menaquinone biosynthesis C-methylase UbiE
VCSTVYIISLSLSPTCPKSFIFVGAGPGYIHQAVCSDDAFDGEGGIGGIRKLVQLDVSEEMLNRDKDIEVEGSHRCESYRLTADEESSLPFPDGTFDLVLSSQSIHWVNDLPNLFKEVKRVLKPDGAYYPRLSIHYEIRERERPDSIRNFHRLFYVFHDWRINSL